MKLSVDSSPAGTRRSFAIRERRLDFGLKDARERTGPPRYLIMIAAIVKSDISHTLTVDEALSDWQELSSLSIRLVNLNDSMLQVLSQGWLVVGGVTCFDMGYSD
jgi:hypothetical protein